MQYPEALDGDEVVEVVLRVVALRPPLPSHSMASQSPVMDVARARLEGGTRAPPIPALRTSGAPLLTVR